MHYSIASIVAGLLLLFYGRRLFWLFVALIGFAAGMMISSEIFAVHDQVMLLAIGIICGIVGALIALFLQRLAITIAGFLAGATIGVAMANWLGFHAGAMIPGLIGGILGALLLSSLFDWALIFLSSISGASLIVRAVNFPVTYTVAGLIVLSLIGIMIQSRYVTGHRRIHASP